MKQIKINAITYGKLVAAMLDGELTCQELAEETGLHYITVLHYTRELHAAGAAHIARYEPDARGRHNVKVYKIGRGQDAKRKRLTQAQRNATYRGRKKQAQLMAVTAGQAQFVQAANGRLRFEETTTCA